MFSGIAFLLSAIIPTKGATSYMPILSGVTSVLAFANAYLNHKKYMEGK